MCQPRRFTDSRMAMKWPEHLSWKGMLGTRLALAYRKPTEPKHPKP